MGMWPAPLAGTASMCRVPTDEGVEVRGMASVEHCGMVGWEVTGKGCGRW